jgi:sugar lactone lactonase YvrE
MRRVVLFVLVLLAPLLVTTPARAQAFPTSIPVPVDFQPEGLAMGAGSTFYVGSMRTGDIYRGDLRSGQGAVFVHAPAGRAALGLVVDVPRQLLFAAGGVTGAAYVYSTVTGAPVATLQLAQAGSSLINDVVVTRDAAWFTNSFAPVLYRVPLSPTGAVGTPTAVDVTGPGATTTQGINLNGIVATPDDSTLIVSHSDLGALFTIDPATGASAQIAVDGLTAGTVDGIRLQGRTLWVVENFVNTLVGVTLSPDLRSGTITTTISEDAFHVPTAVVRHGNRLALVNARFDLGFPPPFGPGAPPGTTFDVVLVRA